MLLNVRFDANKLILSKKDGSEMMFKEGEYMDVYGKVTPVNNSKNSKGKNMYLVPDSTLQKNK